MAMALLPESLALAHFPHNSVAFFSAVHCPPPPIWMHAPLTHPRTHTTRISVAGRSKKPTRQSVFSPPAARPCPSSMDDPFSPARGLARTPPRNASSHSQSYHQASPSPSSGGNASGSKAHAHAHAGGGGNSTPRPFLRKGSRQEPSALHRMGTSPSPAAKTAAAGSATRVSHGPSRKPRAASSSTKKPATTTTPRPVPSHDLEEQPLPASSCPQPEQADPYWPPVSASSQSMRTRLFAHEADVPEDEDEEEDPLPLQETMSDMGDWQAQHCKELTEFASLEKALEGFPGLSINDAMQDAAAAVAAVSGAGEGNQEEEEEEMPRPVWQDDDDEDDDKLDADGIAEDAYYAQPHDTSSLVGDEEEDEEEEEDDAEGHEEDHRPYMASYRGAKGGKVRPSRTHKAAGPSTSNAGCTSCGARGSMLLKTLEAKQEHLEWEVARAQKEAVQAEKIRRRQDTLLAQVQEKEREVELWARAERTAVGKWCEEQRQALAKEKKAFARQQAEAAQYQALQRATPNRQERIEMEALRATIEKMKLDEEGRRKKLAASNKRQAAVIKEQQTHIADLQAQLAAASSTGQAPGAGKKTPASKAYSPAGSPSSSLASSTLSSSGGSKRKRGTPKTPAGGAATPQETATFFAPLPGSQGYEDEAASHPPSLASYNPHKYAATPPPAAAAAMQRPPPFCPPYRQLQTPQSTQAPKSQRSSSTSRGTPSSSSSATATTTKTYANGTIKELFPDGSTRVRFLNGDVKETQANGDVEYWYAANNVRHITVRATGVETYQFPTGQTETHFPDGTKEIQVAGPAGMVLRKVAAS